MTALKPTEARLALARGIEAGQVVDHGWARGHVTWSHDFQQEIVTGQVAAFRRAGLLETPGADGEKPPYPVRFNDAGKAWLAEHSAAAGDAA